MMNKNTGSRIIVAVIHRSRHVNLTGHYLSGQYTCQATLWCVQSRSLSQYKAADRPQLAPSLWPDSWTCFEVS